MRSAIFLALVMAGMSLFAQTSLTVNTGDFKPALGPWKGSLTYLDYSSGKPFTMPANIMLLNSSRSNEIILQFIYPNEPKANGNDTLRIGMNGTEIDGAKIAMKKVLTDGSLQIVTEKNGFDGNDKKKAILRHIYTIGTNMFSNRKEVKFEDGEKWILRNEYLFAR